MAKALFILFKDYSKTHDGGSQANMRNLGVARELLGDANVDCYYIHDINRKRSPLAMAYSALLFSFGFFNGLTPRKLEKIGALSIQYDYVFITNSVLGLVAKYLKSHGYSGKIISFFHNVEGIYYESRVSKHFPFRSIIVGCAARNDCYALEHSDTVVGLCKRDHNTLKKLYGKGFDAIAPISFADACAECHFDKDVMTESRPRCTFIGSNFPANAEGVLWFVENVLPHVDVDFTVVGQNMDKLKEAHKCLKDIEVCSNVPDLAPYFAEADFMVFPIFDGSGMKVKTCEALMYGKNILGTSETFEGYDVEPGRCGRLCNTAEDYVEAIRDLAAHPVKRFNEYSRQTFLCKYSIETTLDTFKKIFAV